MQDFEYAYCQVGYFYSTWCNLTSRMSPAISTPSNITFEAILTLYLSRVKTLIKKHVQCWAFHFQTTVVMPVTVNDEYFKWRTLLITFTKEIL